MKRSKQIKKAWRAFGRGSLRAWARGQAEIVQVASLPFIPELAADWLKAKGLALPSTTQSAA